MITFAGTFKFPNGQVKSVRFEKLAAGATVPASVAASSAFNGKWSGNAFSQIAGCISGAYDLSVKDGVISGTATFHPREGSPRVSSVTGQVGADGGAALALAPQGEQARRSRFQGKFDKDEFKGDDPAVGGGRCAYAVTLKKAG